MQVPLEQAWCMHSWYCCPHKEQDCYVLHKDTGIAPIKPVSWMGEVDFKTICHGGLCPLIKRLLPMGEEVQFIRNGTVVGSIKEGDDGTNLYINKELIESMNKFEEHLREEQEKAAALEEENKGKKFNK